MTRACRRWPSAAPERCRPRRRKKTAPGRGGPGALWSCAVVNCRRIRNAPAGRVGHTQRFRFISTIEGKGYRIEKRGQIIALAAGHATAPVRTYSAFSTSLQRGMMGLAADEKRRCVITSLPDGLPDPAPPLAGDGSRQDARMGSLRAKEVCDRLAAPPCLARIKDPRPRGRGSCSDYRRIRNTSGAIVVSEIRNASDAKHSTVHWLRNRSWRGDVCKTCK
jgi:hypothetical protein